MLKDNPGKKRWRRASAWGAAATAAVFAVQLAGIAPALANAANPNPDTTATAHVNSNGTVSVTVKGTWSWPGQSCEGRYGEGWAVDWWGISSSPLPTNNFTLTNATEVTSFTTTTTGSITSVGSIPIGGKPGPGGGGASSYFHVAQYYAGQDINSSSTCTDTSTGGTGPNSTGSTGSWSASATYPSKSDMPPQICSIMYDEHGQEGKPSGNANDLSPVNDHDNSIQTNAFNPTQGMGYCVTPKFPPPPPKKHGYMEICKDASGSGLANDVFTFKVQGKSYTVPVGACTSAFRVTAGNVTVKEEFRPGSKLVGVSTIPAGRLVSDNLSSRTAVVKVVPGNVSTQTIVTFTNKMVPGSGYLKVCNAAGSGVAQGTDITYTIGSTKVSVPAGPAPGGYCVVAGKFAFGSQTVTESIPSGDHVTKIVAAPSNRLVSSDTSTGTAVVDVLSGVTEVTFTTAASSS
jgi:hypothetical protein